VNGVLPLFEIRVIDILVFVKVVAHSVCSICASIVERRGEVEVERGSLSLFFFSRSRVGSFLKALLLQIHSLLCYFEHSMLGFCGLPNSLAFLSGFAFSSLSRFSPSLFSYSPHFNQNDNRSTSRISST